MKKLLSLVVVFAAAVIIHLSCALKYLAPPAKRAEMELKNRTAIPTDQHFDPNVTLAALVAPGHDRQRWSTARAASIEGYVVRIHDAGIEAANCFSFASRDTHIEVALRLDASPPERVIVEVTPPIREWARQQGWDWSAVALGRELVGRKARLAGWLFFDSGHDEESQNTQPGNPDNWRATAWEIHPVTAITRIE